MPRVPLGLLLAVAATGPGFAQGVRDPTSDGSVVMAKERTTGLPGGASDTGLAMYRVRNGKIETLWVVSSSSGS